MSMTKDGPIRVRHDIGENEVINNDEFQDELLQIQSDEIHEDDDPYFSMACDFSNMFRTDDEWEWPELVRTYLNAGPDSIIRKTMDYTFVRLCGYSLATIIRKAGEEHDLIPEEEQK